MNIPNDSLISIPGFGCVYPFNTVLESKTVTLKLCSILKDEDYHFQSDDFVLVMPLEAASLVISDKFHEKMIIENGSVYSGGINSKISISSPLAFCRFIILSFRQSLFESVANEHAIDFSELKKYFSISHVLHRPDWLEAICHRYIFERAIMHQEHNKTTDFLELEILKEAYYRSLPVKEAPLFKNLPAPIRKTLMTIEKNILEDIDLDQLAEASSLSKTSLNRLFSRHIGLTPMRYLWGRRLTLASFLLKSDEKSVEEIASLVGFQDLSSFSRAYRRHFGKAPRR